MVPRIDFGSWTHNGSLHLLDVTMEKNTSRYFGGVDKKEEQV
jgi:hypothetical protein